MFIGFVAIVIGVIWLFSANGLVDSQIWRVIWALVLIGAGLALINRGGREKPWWRIFDSQSRTDWERWGTEFGDRVERWSREFGQTAGAQSRQLGREFGRQIEDSIKKLFNPKANESAGQTEAEHSERAPDRPAGE